MSSGELILYQSEDGKSEVQLRAEDGTVWLSQAEMAELFQTTPQNVTQHIKALYDDRELAEAATCKDLLQVRLEGDRDVRRTVSREHMEHIAAQRYGQFDAARKLSEDAEAATEFDAELKAIEQAVKAASEKKASEP